MLHIGPAPGRTEGGIEGTPNEHRAGCTGRPVHETRGQHTVTGHTATGHL